MRGFRTIVVLFVAVSSASAWSGAALADGCDELWYARNTIYKQAGYCFRTARAIHAFGNQGCRYGTMGEVPLSAGQHRAVADILRDEAYKGCH